MKLSRYCGKSISLSAKVTVAIFCHWSIPIPDLQWPVAQVDISESLRTQEPLTRIQNEQLLLNKATRSLICFRIALNSRLGQWALERKPNYSQLKSSISPSQPDLLLELGTSLCCSEQHFVPTVFLKISSYRMIV